MSINDIRQLGPTLGFSESLDNQQSLIYSASGAAASRYGVGITNYRPYLNTTATISGVLGVLKLKYVMLQKQITVL